MSKKQYQRMRIPVRVQPVLREYLIDSTGSDTITPSKGDLIWDIVKSSLETPPADYVEPVDIDNHIYIELLDCHSSLTFVGDRFLHINTLFRWYLAPKAQARICRILSKNFKSVMHSFIQGAVAANPGLQQREAMECFCNTHNLTMQRITPDMIKKSWDRSDHKRKLMDRSVRLNTIFF